MPTDKSKAPLESLADYDKKRDFQRTPEPGPEALALPSSAPRFMVHKHHARRLHYDLRLEIDGALASWAVPRGPSYDPETKRLAVQTEDHPLAYGDFEGRIPDGLYGAGESLIWDRGHYDTVPPGQVSAMRKKGHIHFRLDGEKLQGEWHLLRTTAPDGRRARQGDANASGPKAQWLMVKVPDAEANPALDIIASRPESVLTGKAETEGPAPAFRGSAVMATKPDMPKLLAGGVLGSEHRWDPNQFIASANTRSRPLLPLFAAIDLNTLPIDVSRPQALLDLPARLFPPGVVMTTPGMAKAAAPVQIQPRPVGQALPAELLFLLKLPEAKSRSPALGAVASVALVLRDLFASLHLQALATTAGPRALLLRVAISPASAPEELQRFASRVVEILSAQLELVRDKKVIIDLSLNDANRDAAAVPMPLEKIPNAPRSICAPLDWNDVSPELNPSDYNARWLEKNRESARAALEKYRAAAAPLPRVK